MEALSADGREFVSNGQHFYNGNTRSDEQAFSGQYASKCTPQQKFGVTAVLPDLQGGDVVEARIWRYEGKGQGALVIEGDWGYWESTNTPVQKRGVWELLEIKATVPLGTRSASMKVYPYFKAGTAVWFDDLRIRLVQGAHKIPEQSVLDSFPDLNIQVTEQGYQQLSAKREEALRRGNLISGKADLVPARLQVDGQEIPAKVRLKGDLLDHLQGKKWSFRILCERGSNWRGMTVFSIHNAASRYYLDEWIYHRLLLDEGLLTTPYDFLKVSLNGDFLGIYAWEEHFTDHLLKSQGREPGVIIRIDEAGHWLHASENLKDRPPWYQSAGYEPYESKKVLNDPLRKKQWLRAQELLYGFLKGELRPAEVFDTARMARFIAINDLARSFHALNFTNIRFYYDPLHDRLEPLGYDGYSTDGTKWFKPPALFGSHYNSRSKDTYEPGVEGAYLGYRLFNDMDFVRQYVRALQEITSEEYVNRFLEKHLPEMDLREEFIRLEYTGYDFKWGDYFSNAAEIRKLLQPLALTSVKAWQADDGELVLENYFLFPVEVVGFGNKGNKPQRVLPEPLILEAYNKDVPVRRYRLSENKKFKYIYIRTLGLSTLHRERITPWQAPEEPRLVREEMRTPDFVSDLGNGLLSVPFGKYELKRDWVIPEGYVLRLEPGVELDLQEGAMIISRSPLDWRGTAEAPIRLHSSDGTGAGLLLLEAGGRSRLEYVSIEGMSARRSSPPFTRGSFSVYKSEAALSHFRIEDSRAENALHLSFCRYQIDDLSIFNSSGDAIDADRSVGEMSGLYIRGSGEDGLEVSAGSARLSDLRFEQIREAALRANEGAEVTATRLSLRSCTRGLIAQDEATLTATELRAEQVKQLFLAYHQSEQAASGGQLHVKGYTQSQVDRLQISDEESVLVVE